MENGSPTWRRCPRINRACRDWSVSFFQALKAYGISVTASFSMELGNGDDSTAAGIAQRYPDGSAVWVNTPALQTNFGPASTAFWQQVYPDMAGLMATAGVTPYLQFGEVQWWYFAGSSGMPFYDAYTTSAFQAQYGRPMAVITEPECRPRRFSERMRVSAGAHRAIHEDDHGCRCVNRNRARGSKYCIRPT